jgi:tetratricopeptide (TPR) repeat protein
VTVPFQNLNLHISKSSKKNGLETVVKDGSGNAVAEHSSQLYADPYLLSTLEDSVGKDVKKTSEVIQKFGLGLYHAVFGGEVLGYYKSLLNNPADIHLKLVFKHNEPDLLRLPWEFLFDGTNFLSAYPRLTMLRALDGVPLIMRTPIEGKIRILVIVSSPLDLPESMRLQFEQEQLFIYQALDRLDAQNKVEIEFLEEASLKNIQDELDDKEYHILHYSGHGDYSDKEDAAYLLLEDDTGKKSRLVDNKTFAGLLAGYNSLRLVFLSGCQTAKTSGRRALSDLATPLLLSGVPAVVAMQYSVTDGSAMDLAKKFYTEIGNGIPVDLALTRARKELSLSESFGQVEFGTPVLFSSDPDCLAVAVDKKAAADEIIRVSLKPNVVLGLEQLGRQFIGRRRELRRIKEDFLARGIRAVVLHGIGGIGKTVTATQIAGKLATNFHGIYAFDCRSGLTIEEILIQLNEFLKRLGVQELDAAMKAQIPVEQKVDYLAQALSQVKLLLIFDNFETLLPEEKDRREIADPSLKKGLGALVKQCTDGSRFLFTSRYTFNLTDERLTNVIDEINLGEMGRIEALQVMNRFPEIADADWEIKEEIYARIGGHPYTINIFGRHARHTSAQKVLADLSGVQREMVDFTLLDKSYQKLSDRAKKIIDGAAVFKKAVRLSGLQWMVKTNGRLPDITNEIEELMHWGLIIKIDEDGDAFYQVHMLVRDFVRRITKDDDWKQHQITGARYYEDLVNMTHDIWDYLEARELYFDAGEFDEAGGIVRNVMEPLYIWGFIELVRKLNQETIDTATGEIKAAAYHNLGVIYQGQGDYEKAIEKYTQSLKIEEELGNKGGIANSLHQLGMIHQAQGNYDKALEKYTQSLKIEEELRNKRGIAQALHQLGTIHHAQGDYKQALEKYTQSLKINEALGDQALVAATLHNIAAIHHVQGEYKQALEKYTQSLRIREALGDMRGIAESLHQLGMLHEDQDEYEQAIEKYTESLKIKEALGDKRGIAYTLGQLGNIYKGQGEYDKAIENYNLCLKYSEELGDKASFAKCLHALGMIHQAQGDYDQALEKCTQSLKIEEALGDKDGIAITLGQMGRIYEAQKKYKEALSNYLFAYVTFEQLKSPNLDIVKGFIAGLREKIGEKKFNKLLAEVQKEEKGGK